MNAVTYTQKYKSQMDRIGWKVQFLLRYLKDFARPVMLYARVFFPAEDLQTVMVIYTFTMMDAWLFKLYP